MVSSKSPFLTSVYIHMEPIPVHFHRVYADMDQQINSGCLNSDRMAGVSNLADFPVSRGKHFPLLRVDAAAYA